MQVALKASLIRWHSVADVARRPLPNLLTQLPSAQNWTLPWKDVDARTPHFAAQNARNKG
jgi:hypothetical protein